MITRNSIFVALAVALAGAAACSSETVKEPRTAARPKKAWQPSLPKLPKERDRGTKGSIHVDDEIARLCNLPTAHFDFDSAAITPSAAEALDALERCFTTGPLKGHSMKIVGHADPRGTVEYNFALGQRRAGTVAEYLEGKGLDPNHVVTSSMGELEATGQDEQGWAQDRKVEIFLADAAPPPQGKTSSIR